MLPFRAPRPRRSRAASTLAATMLVVAAVVTFLSISVLITSQFGRYAGRQNGDSDEMAACDAALDYAYAQWKSTCYNAIHTTAGNFPASNLCYPANGVGTAPGTPALPNAMAASFNSYYNSTFAKPSGVICFNLQILKTDQNGIPASYDTSSGGEPVFSVGTPDKLQTSNVPGYPGWFGYTYNYVAVAGVMAPSHFGNPHPVSATLYMQVTKVPLFQAAIFYEKLLELFPGAPMVVTGPVHSNQDIRARGFDTLQFNNNVSSVGTFYNVADSTIKYGWDGSNYGYLPGINYPYYDPTTKTYGQPPLPTWGNATNTTPGSMLNQVAPIDPFGGASTNNNGLHDIVEVPAVPDPTKDQIAYNNASIRIMIDDTQSPTITTTVGKNTTTSPNPAYITMYDRNNAPIPYSTSNTSVYNAVYSALSSYPTTDSSGNATVNTGSTAITQTIQDLREASTVTMTSIDMKKLTTATAAMGNSFSGTVYVHYIPHTTSNPLPSNARRAIRLYDGGQLAENVTVATDNGMYIQGDYNTGTDNLATSASSAGYYTNVGTNGGVSGQTQPVLYKGGNPAYTRFGTAVMADAVTILSNNWKDTNSSDTTVADRKAVVTTVNTAILAGDVPSNYYPGYASGGAHNFPRFLEDWSNVNFTYFGSLVEAFNSATFIGKWQTAHVYNWPNRPWSFDTNLLDNLPPGVPMGLQFTRGRWQRVVLNSNT